MPLGTLHGNGRTVGPGKVARPEERLNWPATIAIGARHVIAMFGATFLVPIITGFPVSTTLLFSATSSRAGARPAPTTAARCRPCASSAATRRTSRCADPDTRHPAREWATDAGGSTFM